ARRRHARRYRHISPPKPTPASGPPSPVTWRRPLLRDRECTAHSSAGTAHPPGPTVRRRFRWHAYPFALPYVQSQVRRVFHRPPCHPPSPAARMQATIDFDLANPLGELISDEVYAILEDHNLLNEKGVRDYQIRRKFRDMREDNIPAY